MDTIAKQRMARPRAFLAAVLIGLAGSAFAGPGDYDTTFGGTGVVFVGPPIDVPNHWAAIHQHNSIVSVVVGGPVGGRSARVYRTLEDGTADGAWGTGGSTLLPGGAGDFTPGDVTVDRRNRTLVVIQEDARFRVFRLTVGGLLDPSFGVGGVADVPIADRLAIIRIAAQSDRKVLVAMGELNGATGTWDLSVRRLNENGSLDAAFGTAGVFRWQGPGPSTRTWGAGVGLQADQRIIVSGRYNSGGAGYTGYVLRLTTSGALDATFGTGGYTSIVWTPGPAFLNSARHLAVMGDDRIVAGGHVIDQVTPTNASAALARLHADGSFDATFGSGGKTTYPMPPNGGNWYQVAVASNDKVILGGLKFESADQTQSSGSILRFRDNGVIDTAFAGDGTFEYAPLPYTGGTGSIIDRDDRPVGVWIQSASATSTPSQPVLVRVEAGRRNCP